MSKEDTQSIEALTERFRTLDTERTRVQALLDSATGRLEELLQKAEEEYGSRDLKDLEAKLNDLEIENSKMKLQFQKHLEKIEKKLSKIDEEFEAEPDENYSDE